MSEPMRPIANTPNAQGPFPSQINGMVGDPGIYHGHHDATTNVSPWKAQARIEEEINLLWRMIINLRQELSALRACGAGNGEYTGQ